MSKSPKSAVPQHLISRNGFEPLAACWQIKDRPFLSDNCKTMDLFISSANFPLPQTKENILLASTSNNYSHNDVQKSMGFCFGKQPKLYQTRFFNYITLFCFLSKKYERTVQLQHQFATKPDQRATRQTVIMDMQDRVKVVIDPLDCKFDRPKRNLGDQINFLTQHSPHNCLWMCDSHPKL